MERISELNLDNYKVKEGDIKVDSLEMKVAMEKANYILSILCNNLDILDNKEQEELRDSLSYFEFMQNKYIVLADLRNEQKRWWDIKTELDKGNKGNYKGVPTSEIENAKKNVWEYYMEAKMKREALALELEEKKKILFDLSC